MIEREELMDLHEVLNRQFYGASGTRNEENLISALARPQATFDGHDLYPGPVEKAAALAESLVKNHPFQEGNTRTAYVVMRLLLLEGGYDIEATEEERYNLMLDIATSRASYDRVVLWLHQHVVKI